MEKKGDAPHCRYGESFEILLTMKDSCYGFLIGNTGCLTFNEEAVFYIASDLEILADMLKDHKISTLDLERKLITSNQSST